MQNPTVIALGRFFFYHRNWVFPLVIAALFLAVPPARGGAEQALDWLGGAAILLGLAVRVVVIAATPVRRDGQGKRVNAEALRISGLFAVCRNPLYVGNLLIAAGYFLLHGAPVVIIAGTLLTLLIYQAIIANEESFLRGKFGAEYKAYMAATNRWWPRLSRLAAAFRDTPFTFLRALRIERSIVLFATLISAAALWYEAGTPAPVGCALAVLLLGGAYYAAMTVVWLRHRRNRRSH